MNIAGQSLADDWRDGPSPMALPSCWHLVDISERTWNLLQHGLAKITHDPCQRQCEGKQHAIRQPCACLHDLVAEAGDSAAAQPSAHARQARAGPARHKHVGKQPSANLCVRLPKRQELGGARQRRGVATHFLVNARSSCTWRSEQYWAREGNTAAASATERCARSS